MSPLAAQTHSAPAPVVQDVTSDILVPEVMKLIWWSVSDMANKQSPVLLPEHWKLALLNGLRNVFFSVLHCEKTTSRCRRAPV